MLTWQIVTMPAQRNQSLDAYAFFKNARFLMA